MNGNRRQASRPCVRLHPISIVRADPLLCSGRGTSSGWRGSSSPSSNTSRIALQHVPAPVRKCLKVRLTHINAATRNHAIAEKQPSVVLPLVRALHRIRTTPPRIIASPATREYSRPPAYSLSNALQSLAVPRSLSSSALCRPPLLLPSPTMEHCPPSHSSLN